MRILTDNRFITLAIVLSAALASGATSPARAAPPQDDWRFSLVGATATLPEADLDAGGETRLRSFHMRADARRKLGSAVQIGVGMGWSSWDRDFSGQQGFAALKPWRHHSRLSLAGTLRVLSAGNWAYGLRPFVEWSSEQGDLASNSASWGAVGSVVKLVSRERRLGVGLSVTRDIDDTVDVVPVPVITWRLGENWWLDNPREAHFTAPAGLELSYRPDDAWRFGLAGIYRSTEFRLDNDAIAPNGIGESEGILALFRASRRLAKALDFHAYLGALFNGELSVTDTAGNELAADNYDTAPLAAIAIEGAF